MTIRWERDKGIAWCGGVEFGITCDVRNELNGRRALHKKGEVVNCIKPGGAYGEPYMPRPFPKGRWKVYAVEGSKEDVYFPLKIRTDAGQEVDTWILDKDGGYDKPSGRKAMDIGYLLHLSNSKTTLGCGRVNDFTQVVVLGAMVMQALGRGEEVWLEVV